MVPVLSRGKHRNPRKGACFMEFASFLAGEPWSDHPGCTHPLLAALAREVNDSIGDGARREIAPLVPLVIGLNARDPVIDARLAREVALAELPIAAMQRQRVAAVGLLRCEAVLNELEGRPASHLSARVEAALADVPDARDWAREYTGMGFGKLDKFASRSAPAIVHSAVGYSNLGFCHELAGDPAEAERAYRTGIERDSDSTPCRINYGLMLARHGRIEEGVAQMQAVLSEAEVHFNVGSVHEGQGRLELARMEYRKALELDPKLRDATLRLEKLNTVTAVDPAE